MDRLIIEFDRALRALFGSTQGARSMPGEALAEGELSAADRAQAAALMRVNHCGEICAQALYQGQAWVARDPTVRDALRAAAREEAEHLAWTQRRIRDLGGRKSLLNPLWYGGSLAIGTAAGRLGDGWSLGFLAETERQVEAHLAGHLQRLPEADRKSWAVLEQMKADETEHGRTAERLGARELPFAARWAMRLASRLMTGTSYWV